MVQTKQTLKSPIFFPFGVNKLAFNLDENRFTEAFAKAKDWIKKELPDFAEFADEPTLEFVEVDDGWDIRPSVSLQKITVNLKRVRWHLEREQAIKYCPKYDIETALIHDLFEYCYLRRWGYPEDDAVIISIVHSRAKVIENTLRRKKGLSDWV